MEIEGYKNYLIYNDGRVFNKKYKRFLKGGKSKKNYCFVILCKNNITKHFLIHRLVAKHYCINEKPEEYNEVDHIDRNKQNNHYTNLRWCNSCINQQNRSMPKNNKIGYKNISILNNRGYIYFRVNIQRNKIKYDKLLKTLEEAIKYRDEILSSFN